MPSLFGHSGGLSVVFGRRPIGSKRGFAFLGAALVFIFLIRQLHPTKVASSTVPRSTGPSLSKFPSSFSKPSFRRKKASHGALSGSGQKESFRDNLRNDIFYITSWMSGGWSNEVMGQCHLMYLALQIGNDAMNPLPVVPVLTPFTPHATHMNAIKSSALHFSDVFDLDSLSDTLQMPIVEWRELKRGAAFNVTRAEPITADTKDGSKEELLWDQRPQEKMSCWSSLITLWYRHARSAPTLGQFSQVDGIYSLDVSYTPIPPKLIHENSVLFPHMASLLSPPSSAQNPFKQDYLSSGHRSPWKWAEAVYDPDSKLSGDKLGEIVGQDWRQPDGIKTGEMICLDSAYYFTERGGNTLEAWKTQDAVIWHRIGQHLQFTPEVKRLASEALTAILKLPSKRSKIPPFVSVHIRRTDFMVFFKDYDPLTVAAFKDEVDRMKALLGEGARVVVTTDETKPEYLATIAAEGWALVDPTILDLSTYHDDWAQTVVDSCILSMGSAFVGTSGSTMSMLAALRVNTWQGGPTAYLPK